jgi:hypothetical protein
LNDEVLQQLFRYPGELVRYGRVGSRYRRPDRSGLFVFQFRQHHLVWLIASAIPLGAIYWFQSSDRSFRKEMARLKALQESGAISRTEYYELKRAAIRWFKERWYGRQLPPADEENQPPP